MRSMQPYDIILIICNLGSESIPPELPLQCLQLYLLALTIRQLEISSSAEPPLDGTRPGESNSCSEISNNE